MQRWTYFATGIMAGIIAVLLTVVIMQNREPQAWAAPSVPVQDNNGQGLMMGTGGAQTQTQDILWVIYRRPGGRKVDKDGALSRDERLALACYQVGNGARNIKLVAVRDITFDLDVVEYSNDKPHVKDIIEELKKSIKAEERK